MTILPLLLAFAVSSAPSDSTRKTALAVMPLQSRTLDPEALDILSSTLATELMNSGVVRVMERSQMERILQEQGFQKSGACDGSECAVEIGRILTVERILLGSVGKFGTAHSLSLRMVDVQTGEVLRSVSRSMEGPQEAILTRLVPQAVQELLQVAPPKPKRDLAKEYAGSSGSYKDPRDGKKYRWVRIGGQVWMARNLDRDTVGGTCYQGKSEKCSSYGRLYDWVAARNICPQDWHLPTSAEFDSLFRNAGGIALAGTALKESRNWDGTDALGFKALPAGEFRSGNYSGVEGIARFWTSSPSHNQDSKSLGIFLLGANERAQLSDEDRSTGMSVRCVLDVTAM